jgi:ParB-like chromosome segregation protein Spo0J
VRAGAEARTIISKWRADAGETIAALVPYANNSRVHSEKQIAQIAASIREFGFTNPVLIDPEGEIIAGHGRVLAARQLEMAQIPTICLSGLSETQRRAYIIADNKLALNAGWDPELLRLELGELKLAGFDLALTGFGELEQAEAKLARAREILGWLEPPSPVTALPPAAKLSRRLAAARRSGLIAAARGGCRGLGHA